MCVRAGEQNHNLIKVAPANKQKTRLLSPDVRLRVFRGSHCLFFGFHISCLPSICIGIGIYIYIFMYIGSISSNLHIRKSIVVADLLI